jgi:hypothetical protein
VKPSPMLFGKPPGVSATEEMSLLVIVRCVSIAAAARERADRAMGKIDVPCAEGCYSCDQVAAEDSQAVIELGCGKEGVIFEAGPLLLHGSTTFSAQLKPPLCIPVSTHVIPPLV